MVQQQQQQQQQGEEEPPFRSWAGETVSTAQPRPVAPAAAGPQGMWTPDAGIRFAPRAGSPAKGTWDPSAGIRFG